MKEYVVSHGGSCGDVIAHLPAMRDVARRAGHDRFRLVLKINTPAHYSERHPCGSVLLTRSMAESLLTLLEVQPYLSSCGLWCGEPVDADFDRFRLNGNFSGDICQWPCQVFLCTPDLSTPWLTVPAEPSGKVLLNRTGRYRNPALDYSGLKAWFVGLASENDTSNPWLPTPTILDLAREIAACKFFFANQSVAFNIAQALDVPRCLEVCPWSANVQPTSSRCFMIWKQKELNQVITMISQRL